MDDVHAVPRVRERVRQAVDIDRIPAETVRRIEGRQVQKIKRPIHSLATFHGKFVAAATRRDSCAFANRGQIALKRLRSLVSHDHQ